MLASNGFDFDHFNAVHDRRLVGSPAIDAPHPFARRTRFAAVVAGGSIFDRLIRAFAGDAVEVSITNWGGTLIFVTGRFRRAGSYMLISSRPTAAHETRVEVIVFAPRDGWPGRAGLQALNLWIRRTFTRAFFSDDIARLSGIRYHPEGLTGGDQDLIDYFNWAATLHGRGAGQARKGPW